MTTKEMCKCRLCFTSSLFHINIFETSFKIIDAIRDVFHSELDENDVLPNHICVDCWMTVQKFHEFYRNVIAAQNKFLLGDSAIKIEENQDDVQLEEADALSFAGSWNFGSGHCDGESGAEHSYETNGPCGNNTVQETKKLLYTSDNEPSECDPYEDADDSDPAFRNNANDSDSDSNIDQSESSDEFVNENDLEDFKPYPRQTDFKPKRKRGRPRKIRVSDAPEQYIEGKRKRVNWREGKIFKCPFCPQKFTRNYRIAVHVKLRHGFECSTCGEKFPSDVKLKQHLNVHEDGFDDKLREKLKEVTEIETNDVSPDEAERFWIEFDRKCEKCATEFESIHAAQVHYLNEHNISKGYVKCCNIKFREENLIKEHIAYHKTPDIYRCFVCDDLQKTKTSFRQHLRNHVSQLLSGNKFVCDKCEKAFSVKSKLLNHMAEAHTDKKIKCELCSKVLASEAKKEKHMRNIHETQSKQTLKYVMENFDMSCDNCEAMFTSFADAKRHYLVEHGEPKGFIKCCNKKMNSLVDIEEHIEWHNNPEIFRCPKCGKLLQVKRHYATHVKRCGRLFTCELCGKVFRRKTTLDYHRKIHENGPKEYQCRFCSLRFFSDEKRNTHEQLIHYGNITSARIVCDICGKGFHQNGHLQNHIKKHHTDEPEKRAKKDESKSEMCTICGLWLSSRYRLKLHRKCHSSEPNRCQECGLEAPNHDALLGHIRAYHEVRRIHKCRLCNESFNNASELQEHGASHATEKLYRCVLCLESFVWRATLDAHVKKAHPDSKIVDSPQETKVPDQSNDESSSTM